MIGYLVAEEGLLTGLVVPLTDKEEWIIGRDPDESSIVLEDPSVSRKHIVCKKTEEGIVVENLSSVNPITLNGEELLIPTLLVEGALLQIGGTTFRFTEHTPDKTNTSSLDETHNPTEKEYDFPEEESGEEDLSIVDFSGPPSCKWLLKVISGPNAGAEFPLETNMAYTLGRDSNVSDVVFHDLSVSRQHAKLTVDPHDHLFIQDLHTRNGVMINGEMCGEKKELSSQDLIALGTTSFLVIDQDQIHETIISPLAGLSLKTEEALIPHANETQEEGAIPSGQVAANVPKEVASEKSWKEMIIPTKHLLLAGIFGVFLLIIITSTFSLFQTEPVDIVVKNNSDKVKEALASFPSVQSSYNDTSGKLFLIGHVLTGVDKQELSYTLSTMPFIRSVEDTVVVDEYVWQNMNALLLFNPEWQAINIYASAPGRFVMKGFVQTLEQAQVLSEYVNTNFPYPNLLDNQITIGDNLLLQIQSLLIEQGFDSVIFSLANGELVLSGRIDEDKSSGFSALVTRMQSLPGIRVVKNFVVAASADTSRIDLSGQYQVTGFSSGDNDAQFIVINQKIFSVRDFLNGMLITDIQPNQVLLEKDGIKFRINYNLQ